jgi:hypothetical protein
MENGEKSRFVAQSRRVAGKRRKVDQNGKKERVTPAILRKSGFFAQTAREGAEI